MTAMLPIDIKTEHIQISDKTVPGSRLKTR